MRLLLVSDIRIFREGLAFTLQREHGIEMIEVAAEAEEVLTRVRAESLDVVLVDIAMPRSVTLVGQVTELAPQTKVVALGLAENAADVISCVEAGIAGYLPPDGSVVELVAIIRSIHRNEFLCSPQIAATLLHRVQSLGDSSAALAPALSRREWEVAGCLAEGLSNKAIARRLSIRPATVKNHVHRVLDKLQVRGRAEVAGRLWRETRPTPRHTRGREGPGGRGTTQRESFLPLPGRRWQHESRIHPTMDPEAHS